MVAKLPYSGAMLTGANSWEDVIRLLTQSLAHRRANDITDLVNNSGGTAGTLTAHTTYVNAAAVGSSLAEGTTTDAAMDTVHDAIGELFTTSNALATALGITTITNNAGGTTPNGTIAAVTVSVTGAATGAQASNMETVANAFDNALYQCARQVNEIAEACGLAKITLGYSKDVSNTIAAITVAVGTAADPGVTKVAADANLVIYQNNIKTIAAKLIEATTTAAPLVLAV